jgi:PAS domain S-box-containing protein
MKKYLKKIDSFASGIFRKKHYAVVISALFFILFGIAFYLIYLDSEVVKEQIYNDFNEQQLILARQASSQLDFIMSNFVSQLENTAHFGMESNPSVLKLSLRTFTEQNKSLGVIDAGYKNSIDDSYLVDSAIANELKSCHELNIDTLLKVNESRFFLSPFAFLIGKDDSIKIYGRIIIKTDKKNGKMGIIYTTIDFSRLMQNVLSNVRSGKTGYAWVINENGIALYHAEKDFIGRNIFEARKERIPYVNYSQINNIMKERMMKGEEGKGIYESWWHRSLKGQITKLIAFTPISNDLLGNRTWSIAVVAPISEVAEELDSAYIRHLLAELFIVIGMFLFGFVLVAYQRRVSESLKARVSEQEEYIESILRNSLDAIIFTDSNNLVKVWNKGAEKVFGYTSDEMIGHSFRRLVPPEIDSESEFNYINDLVNRNGYLANYITDRLTKSGRRITVNISKTLISSSKGEVLGYSIILRDETEKRLLEQRIYNTEKLASIGTLAAGVAHEINNPLAVILGFTDLLLESFPKESQIYKDLKTVETNANNAKKIVENLLGFARITEGMAEVINLKLSINTVANIIRNTLFTSKIELEVLLPDDLPDVKGDAREFQQVIFNLINNSSAAMKKQGKGKIKIESAVMEKEVIISITDTGEGIPKRIKQKIFDPFFTTKNVGEGTGLGLSLCYGIIHKFGGRIEFESSSIEDSPEAPSYSTFSIILPIINQGQNYEV